MAEWEDRVLAALDYKTFVVLGTLTIKSLMHESRNVVIFFEQWYQPVATTGAIGPPGPSTCVGRPQA